MVMSDDRIVVVDLFAGAGGLSTGCAMACEQRRLEPGVDVELHAINHSECAIETHKRNHQWAEHYHAKIEELYPPDVVEPGAVNILSGGPQCTHHSNARGGKPKKEQMRSSAWRVLEWVEHLRPEHVLLENVKEFRTWAPVGDEGGEDGCIFELFIEFLERFGYTVDHRVLNCANYGDPTSRDRLFIVASRTHRPSYPEPTHARDPRPDSGLEPWRTAAEIIDWSDPGTSVWTRDLEYGRYSPLAQNTMARIAEGIRRHSDPRFRPLADAIEGLGNERDRHEKGKDVTLLDELRENIVPIEHAGTVAEAVDNPFLVRVPDGRSVFADPSIVKLYGTSTVSSIDGPLHTVTADGGHHCLSVPEAFALRQQSGGVPCPVSRDPLPTVAAKGAIGLANPVGRPLVKPRNGANGDLYSNETYPPEKRPFHVVTAKNHDGHLVSPEAKYLIPGYNERAGQRPRTREVDRPLMTVPAKRSPASLCSVWIDDYEGPPDSIVEPLGTVTGVDRFALCVPEAWPWGLDVRYRMLKPSELKQAQGFPEDYEIAGDNKSDRTKQIGNAVPVNTATSLFGHLLDIETPSLSTFGGGITPDADVEVPEYEEVASADD